MIGDWAASPEDRGVVNLTQEFAMGTDAISPLRQRMIEDMSARQLSPPTQKSHIRACKRFAAFLKRSPETATADDNVMLSPEVLALLRQWWKTRPRWYDIGVP